MEVTCSCNPASPRMDLIIRISGLQSLGCDLVPGHGLFETGPCKQQVSACNTIWREEGGRRKEGREEEKGKEEGEKRGGREEGREEGRKEEGRKGGKKEREEGGREEDEGKKEEEGRRKKRGKEGRLKNFDPHPRRCYNSSNTPATDAGRKGGLNKKKKERKKESGSVGPKNFGNIICSRTTFPLWAG
ncbi:Mnn4, partial [Ophiophagus hannah]